MGRFQGNTSPPMALQTLLEEFLLFFVCVLSPMGYFKLLLTGWCLEEIRPSQAEGTLEIGMPTMQWVRSLMPFC